MGLQFLKKGVLMAMLLNTLNGYAQTGDDKGSDKSRVLSIFYQAGFSPRKDNLGYFDAGCTYSGLQPDLQYVVHPGGTDVQLKNATVGLMRLGMEF